MTFVLKYDSTRNFCPISTAIPTLEVCPKRGFFCPINLSSKTPLNWIIYDTRRSCSSQLLALAPPHPPGLYILIASKSVGRLIWQYRGPFHDWTYFFTIWSRFSQLFVYPKTHTNLSINLNQNTTWPSAMLDFHVPVLYIVVFILDPLIVQPYN
jgi:hypothetical protein